MDLDEIEFIHDNFPNLITLPEKFYILFFFLLLLWNQVEVNSFC